MRIKDVMSRDVVVLHPDTSVGEVAHLMQRKNIHRLLVLNRASRLVGMVSQDDLVAQ